MVNGKEGNSVTYPKTYIITAAQAIQSEKHANMYAQEFIDSYMEIVEKLNQNKKLDYIQK